MLKVSAGSIMCLTEPTPMDGSQPSLQGKDDLEHEAAPEGGDAGKDQGEDQGHVVDRLVVPGRRDNAHRQPEYDGDEQGVDRQGERVGNARMNSPSTGRPLSQDVPKSPPRTDFM